MKYFMLGFVIMNCFYSKAIHASIDEETQRFRKCYALFVKEALDVSHPLYVQVKKGTKSGTDACMEVLDYAALNSSNEIKQNKDGSYNVEGIKVMKTFNDLHRSFFSIPDFSANVENTEQATLDVIDANEPAYHITYSLLKSGEKYSNIVTRSNNLVSVRNSLKSERKRAIANINAMATFTIGDPSKNNAALLVDWFPRMSETGILVGIKPDADGTRLPSSMPGANAPYANYNITQLHGGGIIGTQAFLIGNSGAIPENKTFQFPNGGLSSYRRWSKYVLGDLLCRDLPALRTSDVVSEVSLTSSLSYRGGTSCMACHAAMDPMAGSIRNLASTLSANSNATTRTVRFFIGISPDKEEAPYPVEAADPLFSRRPPIGRLKYRSYDSSLVSIENINGVANMGKALANTNDLYVCAAKKYYKFLTGINVNLADLGDKTSPVNLNSSEEYFRNKVINLGTNLKSHQSLKQLIREVISSPTFIYPDKGV